MRNLRHTLQLGAVLAWTILSVGILNGESKTDFPKGLMFAPGEVRQHYCRYWPADSACLPCSCYATAQFPDEQALRSQYMQQFFGGTTMQRAYTEMDTFNLNWYYQCYLTEEDIAALNRPDLRFSTVALPGRWGQYLEASRCYMNVGWENTGEAQSDIIEHGMKTLWPGEATDSNNVANTVNANDLVLPSDQQNILRTVRGTNQRGWMIRPDAREDYHNLADGNVRSYTIGGGTTSNHHRWTGGNFDWWHNKPEGRTGFVFEPLCRVPPGTEPHPSDTVAAIVVCMASYNGTDLVPPNDRFTPEEFADWAEGEKESLWVHRRDESMDFGLAYLTADMFQTPGEWEKVTARDTLRFWFPVGTDFRIGIFWYGSVSFDIAALDIRDEYYDALFDEDGSATAKMDSFVSVLNALPQGMPGAAIQTDEPTWGQFKVLGYLNDHVAGGITMNDDNADDTTAMWAVDLGHCRHLSNDQTSPSGLWAAATPKGWDMKITGYDNSHVNDEVERWSQCLQPYTSTNTFLSTTGGSQLGSPYADYNSSDTVAMSLQAHWDQLIDCGAFLDHMISNSMPQSAKLNNLMRRRTEFAYDIVTSAGLAKSRDIRWSAYISHTRGFNGENLNVYLNGATEPTIIPNREHTPAEMWSHTGLNLAYGAKGIIWAHLGSFMKFDSSGQWANREYLQPQCSTLAKIYASLDTVGPLLQACRWDTSFCTRSYEQNFDFPYILNGGTLIDTVYTKWNNTPYLTWSPEAADSTFIQVGVFEAPNGSPDEHYLFLVNRRCEPTEERRVYVSLDMPQTSTEYRCELARGDSNWVVTTDANGKVEFMVQLPPGEYELFHIRPNTDWIITGVETIYAPYQLNRNIRIRNGGSLTILPEPGIASGDSAVVTCWKDKGIFVDRGAENSLSIIGSDSNIIKFRSLDGLHDKTNRWAGLRAVIGSTLNNIHIENALIEDASVGIWIGGTSSNCTMNNSTIRHCMFGAAGSGFVSYQIDSCTIEVCDAGFLAYNGVAVRTNSSEICSNNTGFRALNGVTATFNNVNISNNGLAHGTFGHRALEAINSDIFMKCTSVSQKQ